MHLNGKFNNKYEDILFILKQFTKNNSISEKTELVQKQKKILLVKRIKFKIGDNVLARSYNYRDK